ncbi:MAG: OmpP1/FadL family transporter [Gammaproteobacteria bacterium]|nr:OmpP1/FadL family transporter [Gammaproteobacteria bacterium]
MKKRIILKLSIGFSSLFIIESSFAAGFQINELSPTIQATALADAATASGDISGMAYNPATLSTIKGTEIYLGATELMPDVGYNNAQANIDYFGTHPVTGVNSESNITLSAFVPDAYIGTSLFPRLTDNNLKIGLGIDAPFGLETNYNSDWVGQYNALESKIQVINVFPTIAYQITPKLSAGASINFENISATLSNNYILGEQSSHWTEGNSSLTGNAWSVGYALGLMYQLTSTTTIGADYHSSVDENINGTATVQSNGPLHIPSSGAYNGQVDLVLPATANSQKIGNKLTLMAGTEWTQWDSIQSINANIAGLIPGETSTLDSTPLHYTNSWLYSLGARYQFTQKFSTSGGLAYDATPTNDQYRDARIPDTNRKWVTIGCQYAPTANFNLFATYEHIFMNDQSISLTQNPISSTSPVELSADYTGSANILAGGLSYTF